MSKPVEPPPPPERFDPWAPRNRGRAMRFFAASTGIHVVLLAVLATVTMHIVRQVEQIRVKVVDESPFGVEDFDGAPSLADLAGALQVSRAQARQARPAGPRIQNIKAPQLPQLGGIGPKSGRGPALDDVPALSFGSGAIGGLGGSFGDYVGGLRKTGLDIALVIDTTESMQFAIDEVKAKLSSFVATVQRMVPATRVGIVAYRDQGDEYVVRWTDLSFKTSKLSEFLGNIRASGGGDWEEAVLEGLDTAIHELSWRKKSKKIIILVGGSPPHPWDVDAVDDVARQFRSDGGYISTVDVTRRLHEEFDRFMWRSLQGSKPYKPSPMPEYYKQTAGSFQEIAKNGGGEMMSLDQDKALIREVMVLTFGSRWKVEMARFMNELS